MSHYTCDLCVIVNLKELKITELNAATLESGSSEIGPNDIFGHVLVPDRLDGVRVLRLGATPSNTFGSSIFR